MASFGGFYLLSTQHLLAAETNLVPSLLTGGGFVFLAAVVAGLFLLNKNKADGAKSIAEGATELVTGIRAELKEVRDDRERLETKCEDCRLRLTRAEQRMKLQEEREAKIVKALRTLIGVIDANDPTALQDAINVARELV